MKPLSKINIYFQLIVWSNLFPIFCVYKYGWSFFEVLWLYWLEALVLVIFDVSKLLMAQENVEHRNFLAKKINMAVVMFIVRVLLLLFYLLFMFVFIAVMSSNTLFQSIQTMVFRNVIFNTALIGFIVTLYYEYAFNYIGNNVYVKKKPEGYYSFFNASTIVMHVVIVLGVVGNAHFNKGKAVDSNTLFLVIFVVVKTIAAVISYWLSKPFAPNNKTYYI